MEFQIQQSMRGAGAGLQDYYLVTGAVHSGPISAVRYVGYVGLALYMGYITCMAVFAYRLIQRVKPTVMFAPVLFFCIPIIYDPFGYTFIFGALDQSYPQAIFHLGLLKFLANSIDDYESGQQAKPENTSASRRQVTYRSPRRERLEAIGPST